jgi:putative ABC transport system permease protein
MIGIVSLAYRSAWNRRGAALLTVASIAISVALLIGVERLRTQAQTGFTRTVSGVDLIVGARTSSTQLLLYSVFRLGDASSDIAWRAYERIAAQPQVQWSVPLALGDSHRGFRVVGTTAEYFEHLRYGADQPLRFRDGVAFYGLDEVVIGAEVARRLGYALGQRVVLAHGVAERNLHEHDDHPFRVVGILEPTGTPIDSNVLVSLRAIEAIHLNWRGGTRLGDTPNMRALEEMDLSPRRITAFFLGLKRKSMVFALQRAINEFRDEPMRAILPGAALQELWRTLALAENTLRAVSLCVAIASLLGLMAILLATLGERRRELAILRANGARAHQLLALLLCESLVLTTAGLVVGAALLGIVQAVAAPWLQSWLGIAMTWTLPSAAEWRWLSMLLMGGLIAGVVPAWRAYRGALADGLSVRQ